MGISSQKQFRRGGVGKVFLWIIGIFVGLAVLGAIIGEEPETSSTNSGETDTATSTSPQAAAPSQRTTEPAPAPPAPAPKETMHAIGQAFQLGDFSYTIDKVTRTQAIGDVSEYGWGEKASKGAVFLVIAFTIENMSNETATAMVDDFTLVDAKGRKFSPSSDATTTLAMEHDQDWLLTELQPGLPAEQMTAFEVPEGAVGPGLHLVIPEKGFFSSGEVKVSIVN